MCFLTERSRYYANIKTHGTGLFKLTSLSLVVMIQA